MLDPKFIREHLEKVQDMLMARSVAFDLDAFVECDAQRRMLLMQVEGMRQKRNTAGQTIAYLKKSGQDATDALAKMQKLSISITTLQKRQQQTEEEYSRLAHLIPNMLDSDVPIGADNTFNKQVNAWGMTPKFDFKPNDHIDISESLGLVDLKRAAKVAGARFYYLKNDLVRLNQSLIHFALDFLAKRQYTLVQPPYMINHKAMTGAIIAEDFEDVIYKIEDEDLYMIGTSEHAMAAMHSDEIMAGSDLPIKYAGTSPCFRKEAGAHGKDQKGIFRVHQFEKIEQFVFARPEDSRVEHEIMLETTEEFYQLLGIPYRVMLLCSGDLGKVSAKTYDIEAWMAGQGAYREIVSCSNCLDYQSRRLMIRFRDRTSDQTQYLHTLNSTLVATTRVMVAILENFQTKDGHVKIPSVLHSYMGGQKEIVRSTT